MTIINVENKFERERNENEKIKYFFEFLNLPKDYVLNDNNIKKKGLLFGGNYCEIRYDGDIVTLTFSSEKDFRELKPFLDKTDTQIKVEVGNDRYY